MKPSYDIKNYERPFMERCLALARLGLGQVSPNPMVGSVIVWQKQIIGEGYHQAYGGPHAEVNAIASVADKEKLKESHIYVSLEPCAHFGKTPPCADLIIQEGLKKVTCAILDPNPQVAGQGLARIQAAGIETQEGLMAEEARILNRRFLKAFEKQRPYIILKWAESQDACIARSDYNSKWISNELSRLWVHKWRSEEDAIMVGTNTAFYDNPRLNVRDWTGRNPTRIVIDKNLRLSPNLALFDQSQETIVYNLKLSKEEKNLHWVQLEQEGFLSALLEDLHQRNIQSLIIEGGTALLSSFIGLNLWDEARVFKSSIRFGQGIAAPQIKGALIRHEKVKDDEYYEFRNF